MTLKSPSVRYALEPEVAGGWGDNTVADTSVHPPVVQELEYQFDGWLGDELLESFPCFVVTKRLAGLLAEARLTGYCLAQVQVSKSEEFVDVHPETELPEFWWLQVTGAESDDFSLNEEHRLVVSARTLGVLRQGKLVACEVRAVG